MLDGDNRYDAVPDIFPIEIILIVFQKIQLSGILVHHPGQGGLKARHQGSSVRHIDPVAVGVDLFAVILCILKGDLDFDVAAPSLYVDHVIMQDCRIPVDIFDIALYAELFQIGGFLPCVLVTEHDL